ncbi:MAG: CPBP family intramembrane metalloprotease [Clostridiales bacterium]|nr:CPBP family intramembrane metalloprotease [Clostridiales bacterium]
MTPLWLKRDCRAVSLALCSAIIGVVVMRIITYFAPLPYSTYGDEILQSAVFSIPTQLLFFLAIPFCIYKFYGGRTVKQTLEFSSVGRFRAYYLLAIPLGVCVYFLTIGISSAWSGLLSLTGYVSSSSSLDKPTEFAAWMLITEIFLTAVLPAVCEEFVMRGGLLTTAKRSFKTVFCVVLCGVIFGLFHQNIRQVFYTSLFGALAAFLTLKTKSLYPAMLMHFVNNFMSVYIDYASDYGFFGGNIFSVMGALPSWMLALLFMIVAVAAAALVVFMLYLEDKRVIGARREAVRRIAATTADEPDRAAALERELEHGLASYRKPRYKIETADIIVGVSVCAVALCTTVFTYVWGFMY